MKRDNTYFEARLLKEQPSIHAAWKAGKFASLRAALIEAGLKTPRSRLTELINAFDKASPAERVAFLRHLKKNSAFRGSSTIPAPSAAIVPGLAASMAVTSPTPAAAGSGLPFAVAVDRKLTAPAKARILELMDKKGFKKNHLGGLPTAEVQSELKPPFSRLDTSLSSALTKGWRLREPLIAALEDWLIANRHL